MIQTGGFSSIILDFGEIASEVVSRIDLSTWHRYRVAAEQTQASIVLLSQYACAKSSSELQLRLSALEDIRSLCPKEESEAFYKAFNDGIAAVPATVTDRLVSDFGLRA